MNMKRLFFKDSVPKRRAENRDGGEREREKERERERGRKRERERMETMMRRACVMMLRRNASPATMNSAMATTAMGSTTATVCFACHASEF